MQTEREKTDWAIFLLPFSAQRWNSVKNRGVPSFSHRDHHTTGSNELCKQRDSPSPTDGLFPPSQHVGPICKLLGHRGWEFGGQKASPPFDVASLRFILWEHKWCSKSALWHAILLRYQNEWEERTRMRATLKIHGKTWQSRKQLFSLGKEK